MATKEQNRKKILAEAHKRGLKPEVIRQITQLSSPEAMLNYINKHAGQGHAKAIRATLPRQTPAQKADAAAKAARRRRNSPAARAGRVLSNVGHTIAEVPATLSGGGVVLHTNAPSRPPGGRSTPSSSTRQGTAGSTGSTAGRAAANTETPDGETPDGAGGGGGASGGGGGGGGGGAGDSNVTLPNSSGPDSGTLDAAGNPTIGDDAVALAKQRFPAWAWALDDPEIGPILQEAARNPSMSEGELQSRIQSTNWWKSRSSSMREAEVLSHNDPKEWERRIKQQSDAIISKADQIGMSIPGADAWNLAINAVKFGWSDIELDHAVREALTPRKGMTFVGEAAANRSAMKKLADQYLILMTDEGFNSWVTDIAKGRLTMDDFVNEIQRQAKAVWGTLADQIDKGATVRQLLDPYAAVIQRQLGITPDAIDWTDPKWSRLVRYQDPQTGKLGMMDLFTAQNEIRTNPQYGWQYTKDAHDQAATRVEGLLKMFGNVG